VHVYVHVRVRACACARACARECVCAHACVWGDGGKGVRAANLFKVDLEMHHNVVILCSGANGSSPHLSHVMKTNWLKMCWNWPCKSTEELPMQTFHVTHTYLLCYPCIHFSIQWTMQDHSIVPWLTSCHMAHLVKISKFLIGYSAFYGQVGGHITWGVAGLDKDRR